MREEDVDGVVKFDERCRLGEAGIRDDGVESWGVRVKAGGGR